MLGEDLLLDATQVIPLIEAETYLVKLRERVADAERKTLAEQEWTESEIRQLSPTLNPSVRALVDICLTRPGEWVGYSEIIEKANLSRPQLRGALAGLTMTIKSRFQRQNWPFEAEWAGGGEGEMYYRVAPEYADAWRLAGGTPSEAEE